MSRLRMTGRNRRTERLRRTNGAKPPARPPLPASVLVRSELPRTIARVSAAAGERETGGPLLGTVQRSWEGPRGKLLVSVLATVPPGPGAHGRPASVALGRGADGERAASALRWWRSATGLDLIHVGDWHRHPSGTPGPSGGDRRTAERMHEESGAQIWLTAIAVGDRLSKSDARCDGNVIRLGRICDESAQVGFYRQARATGLAPVPIRIEDEAIPRLPALPWHITDPARFAAECRLLRAAGYAVAIDAVAAGRRPGLALRLVADRPVAAGARPLRLVTGPGYPHERPLVLDERGRRVQLDGGWSADRFLIDLIRKVA